MRKTQNSGDIKAILFDMEPTTTAPRNKHDYLSYESDDGDAYEEEDTDSKYSAPSRGFVKWKRCQDERTRSR